MFNLYLHLFRTNVDTYFDISLIYISVFIGIDMITNFDIHLRSIYVSISIE